MSITFGSVGDIIATVQIAIQLITALNESRGSAREIQDLVKSLSTFHQILEQLVKIWPTRSECPQLEVLYKTILPVVRECREDITIFLDAIISRYGRHLAHGDASKHKLKDMGKMLQWHIFEGGAVAKLREKLDNSHSMISLAYLCAQGVAEEKDQVLIGEKLDFVRSRQYEIEQELDQRLDGIQNELAQQRGMLEELSNELRRIHSTISPIVGTSLEIKATSNEMSQMIRTLYQLYAVRPSISKLPDLYGEQSIILEDALGYSLRIPLETIRSWAVVRQVLIDNFSDRPGHHLVRAGRYVLQDSVTGNDLSLTTPFHRATRLGQKIFMTMVFYSTREKDKVNKCPRCRTVTVSSGDQDINCLNPTCDVTFRQVIEESENQAIVASGNNELSLGRWTALGEPLDENQIEDTDVESNTLDNIIGEKRAEDGPEIFKRVRLFTRWQDSAESRGSKIAALDGISFWDVAKTKYDIADQFECALLDHVREEGYHYYAFQGFDDDQDFCCWMGFLGKTLQQSCPILLIYARKQRIRQRITKCLRGDAWIHKNGFLVASCSGQQWQGHLLNWVLENRPEEADEWRTVL